MKKFTNILIATDFSEASAQALRHAALLAWRHEAKLHVLHVNAEGATVYAMGGLPLPEQMPADQQQALNEQLNTFVREIQLPVTTGLGWGYSTAGVINHHAEAHEIDLIVMGSHGSRGLSRFFLGSTAAEVLRNAHQPVLIVNADHGIGEKGYRRAVVGVDFSPYSIQALHVAGNMLDEGDADLVAAHVIDRSSLPPLDTEEAERNCRQRAEDLLYEAVAGTGLPVPTETIVRSGKPYQELLTLAEERKADLLVVAARGLNRVDRWLMGSVTDRVLRAAPCAVLAWREAQTTED